MTTPSHAVRAVAALVLTTFLAWNCAAVVLFNLPDNLLQTTTRAPVERYMLPYFAQSWNFFAPTPGGYGIDYRFRYRYAHAGTVHTTAWLRGSSMFPDTYARNPFHPMSTFRAISYACSTLTTAVSKQLKDGRGDERVDAGKLVSQERCLARLLLGALRSHGPADTAEVQMAFEIQPAQHVNARFLRPTAAHSAPQTVHTTGWISSRTVASFADAITFEDGAS